MAGIGDRRFIPAPSDIAWRYWEMLRERRACEAHGRSRSIACSLASSSAAFPAIAVGLLMAMFRPVRIFFDPLIAALFPIPKIALMPLLLLAFGFGDASKIALVVIRGVFPGGGEHLCRRRQHREDLLGRGEELRRQPVGDVPPHRVLRRAADDLRGAAHRARGVVHRAGGGRVRRHQDRHRLHDLEFVGAAAGRRDVRRHRDGRRARPDRDGGACRRSSARSFPGRRSRAIARHYRAPWPGAARSVAERSRCD